MASNNNICAYELIEAEAQSWDYILSYLRPSCIKCAIQLGIPDILHKNADPIMSLSDLIAALPNLNPSKTTFIPILMRVLVDFGLFNYHQQQGDGYSLTTVGRLLVENHHFGNRSFFLFAQHPVVLNTAASVGDWLKDDLRTAFETADGKSHWDYCGADPEFNGVFNDAMAGDSRLMSNLLISDCCAGVFEGLTSLVDIGGGTGAVAMAIAGAFPSLKCIVLDLPHVIADRKGSGNLEFVAGSMFDKIPHANAILLKRSQWRSAREGELRYAKVQIENAPIINTIPEFHSSVFRNYSKFRRSYELMERVLKVYVYKEGEKPIFHHPYMRVL